MRTAAAAFALATLTFGAVPAVAADLVVPVYRSWNGYSHYYATDYQEGSRFGYQVEGETFKIYSRRIHPDLQPVYKCIYTPQKQQFLSMDANCEGQARQGLLGYNYRTQLEDHAPLYRFYFSNGRWQDHLSTTSYDEGVRAGYQWGGVIGYVPTFAD